MQHTLDVRLEPRQAASDLTLRAIASTRLDIDANRIRALRITRRSIDARQRRVMVNLTLRLWVDEEPDTAPPAPFHIDPLPDDAPQAVIVGAGPAGLFAALEMLRHGVRPIILERGQDVDTRRRQLAQIARTGHVDPDSNYCYGEGGAGAFSDGKLYTRSKKRGPVEQVLQLLVQHGAQPEILVDAHPHIGTDRLPDVIRNIRSTIQQAGGRVHFGTRVTALAFTDDGHDVTGAVTADGTLYSGPVLLATGHSARDLYRALADAGVLMLPKGIAMGVRLEHPQRLIDTLRYHMPQGRGPWLPPAEYTMSVRAGDRGVYSFCMCPGGVIVPATNEEGLLVVNGMSASARAARLANAGIVVELLPEDIPERHLQHGPLAMMAWQEEVERRFYDDGGSLNAPAQRLTDFIAGRPSATLPATSYAPGIHPARVDSLLPPFVAERLREGVQEMGRRHRGFVTEQATVIGCETRTSAPVRLPRHDDTRAHTELPSLYPVGEGAGYAGGIVSAALDGMASAEALCRTLQRVKS